MCCETAHVQLGQGQSVIRTEDDIKRAWDYALSGSRGDLAEVIVESFIDTDYEITLLTLTQQDADAFCPPIGHRQERRLPGELAARTYGAHLLEEAQRMAEAVRLHPGREIGEWSFHQNPTAESEGALNCRPPRWEW